MLPRKISITITDGCSASCTSEFRGQVVLSKEWDGDITLLDAEEGFTSSVIEVRGLRQPTLMLVRGDSIVVGSVNLESGGRVPATDGRWSITVGGRQMSLACLPLFSSLKLAGITSRTVERRRAATMAIVTAVLSVSGASIAANFSDSLSILEPSPQGFAAPDLDFWSEVHRQSSKRFAINMPVMQQKLQDTGLVDFVTLDHDPDAMIYFMRGRIPPSKMQAVENFVRWHGQSGDASIVIDHLEVAGMVMEEHPKIIMVMGTNPPDLFFPGRVRARIGDFGPDGWLYEAYRDGVVTLTKNNNQVNVVVFRSK